MRRDFRKEERHNRMQGRNKKVKSKIIAAMNAAGYHFDEMESSDNQRRFLGECGAIMYMDN